MIALMANVTVAAVAVTLMGLVLRGTIYHMLARQHEGRLKRLSQFDAADWMRLGVGIYHVKSMVRITRWDLYAPLKGLMTNPDYMRSDAAIHWNTSFALMAIAGSLCVLMALYRNIPDEDRAKYGFFGSPWYPGKPPFFFGR